MWGIAWMPLKGLAASGFSGLALVVIASFVEASSLVPRLIAERDSLRGQGAWLLAIAVLGGYANLAFTTATMYGDVVRIAVPRPMMIIFTENVASREERCGALMTRCTAIV